MTCIFVKKKINFKQTFKRYSIFFVGCDSTSSFHGKGKIKVWKTLSDNPEYIDIFSMLGNTFPPSELLVSQLHQFVCLMYGDKIALNTDECRYNLFNSGKYSDDVLPPNSDCLLKHIERANYQTAVWNQSLSPYMDIPSPDGNGWILDGEYKILWMTLPAAPDSLLQIVKCTCKKGCTSQRCSCLKAQLKCSDLCSCENCSNFIAVDEDTIVSEDDDDNDDVSDNDELLDM